MATTFKTFTNNDVTSTRTLLHESIPITGSLVSGAYVVSDADQNVKNFSHGMFQSVYDYPYLSSSANHIFDVTVGYHSDSLLSSSDNSSLRDKKINLYNQFAQSLMGFDSNGAVHKFDRDGDLTGGGKNTEAYFVSFSRLLVKDEIKKGSFELKLGVNTSSLTPFDEVIKITDAGAQNSYKTNAAVGEYGILSASNSLGTAIDSDNATGPGCGLIFYQAGVIVLSGSVFNDAELRGGILSSSITASIPYDNTLGQPLFSGSSEIFVSSSISGAADAFRSRVHNISFNNTTELHSTIYFCRAHHNEFNYSSNTTYLSGSKIRVKNTTIDPPVSYITSVGLYSPQNELLAVAKLSEPLKKTPENELTLRVRLDY
jgi:hypothetical protein